MSKNVYTDHAEDRIRMRNIDNQNEVDPQSYRK